MYKDMYMKLMYHKENIIKDLVKKGIYPSDDIVSSQLLDIDKRLSLLKSYTFVPGTTVNVKELNHCLDMIHKDLCFLYEIVYDLKVNEFNKLYEFVESHILELEATADKYLKRALEETNSTTLGNTLLFESNSFDIEVQDDKIMIDLGSVEVYPGTKVGCFANIANLESYNIKFVFENVNESNNFETLAYNHNHSYHIIPGERKLIIHEQEQNPDFIVNSSIPIDIKNPDPKSDYVIMAASKRMLVKYENGRQVTVPFPTYENPFQADEPCRLSFYMVDGKNLEYNFNTKPNHTNFSLRTAEITIDSDVKNFYLDVNKDFTCYFNYDEGKPYALKEQGVIKNNALIYTGYTAVNDISTREYKRDETLSYNVKLILQSDDINSLQIDSIYIKELN